MSAYLGNQKFQLKSALGGQAGGPAKWGEITGNIEDQADLASKLVEVSASSTLSAKDYTDDKVKDGRLTIIQGDVQKGSFSANQGSNLSIILDPPSSQGEWGNIFGNIEDQRDLTQRIDAAAGGALTDAQEYTDSQIAQLDIPTKVSQLENDAGYLSAHQSLTAYALKTEIPTVNDASITIKQGDDIKGTFTLNQSNNLTVELSAGGGSSGSETDPVFTAWKNGTSISAGASASIKYATSNAIVIGSEAKTNGDEMGAVVIGYRANQAIGTSDDSSCVSIGYQTKSGRQSVSLGKDAKASGSQCVSIGPNSSATGSGAVAVGNNASAKANNSTAIGQNAVTNAQWCIQLGAGTNSTMGSFKVDDWPLLNLSTGKIYADRIEGGSGGGGVTKIIAGSNVTISPASGTGEVTINAAGGSGGSYLAGYGIDIQSNTISVDTTVIATQSYVNIQASAATANANQYTDNKIGAIDSVLDAINGEVI